jgi:hypothetical protein
MGVDSISQILGCSPSGAEALLTHARAQLQRTADVDAGSLDSRLHEVLQQRLVTLPPRAAPVKADPWRWRAGVLIALAFGAGLGSVTIPRWLDAGPREAAPVKPPAVDENVSRRVRLPAGFPRTGPKVPVAGGTVSGIAAWQLKAYRAQNDLVCFELRVGNSYGDRHCASATLSTAHAFASPDPAHRLTFVYGNVPVDVGRVELVEPGASKRRFELVRVPPELRTGRGNLFAGLIAGYLLPMSSEKDAEFQNYELADLSLLGSDSEGQPLVRYQLLLGRPQS